jgi:hypothetical protein
MTTLKAGQIEARPTSHNGYSVLHENGVFIGECFRLEDGFFYFWSDDFQSGAWSSFHLKSIAELLDIMNKEMQAVHDEME